MDNRLEKKIILVEKRIEQKILNLEIRINKLESIVALKKKVSLAPKLDNNEGLKQLEDLKKDGFFKQRKKFKEIIKELKRTAVFSNKIPYRTILDNMVRDKKLKRKQIEHQWAYFEK